MDDLCVVECSDNLEDTVDGSDVGEEGVAETGSGGRTGGETGNVDAC